MRCSKTLDINALVRGGHGDQMHPLQQARRSKGL
jgi:hypothetical protein